MFSAGFREDFTESGMAEEDREEKWVCLVPGVQGSWAAGPVLPSTFPLSLDL